MTIVIDKRVYSKPFQLSTDSDEKEVVFVLFENEPIKDVFNFKIFRMKLRFSINTLSCLSQVFCSSNFRMESREAMFTIRPTGKNGTYSSPSFSPVASNQWLHLTLFKQNSKILHHWSSTKRTVQKTYPINHFGKSLWTPLKDKIAIAVRTKHFLDV